MLFFENIGITVCVIFFFVVFRTSRPPTPPSPAATRNRGSISQGMWKDVKIIFRNKNYVLTMCIFTLIYSLYAGVGFVINPLFYPCGFDQFRISLIGMFVVFFGAIGAVSAGKYLDKTNRYLFTMKCVCFIATVAAFSAIFLMPTGKDWAAVIFCFLFGVGLVPIMPVCFAFGTEVSHPLAPALVVGLMMSSAQIVLFFLNSLYLSFLNKSNPRPVLCLIVMTINPVTAFVLSFFVKEDLRRLSSILTSSMISGVSRSPKPSQKSTRS